MEVILTPPSFKCNVGLLQEETGMDTIEAVVFDFGNVLGRFDKMVSCGKFAATCQYSPEQIRDMLVGSDLERRLESGMATDDFAREVIEMLASTMTIEDVHMGWGDIFTPNDDIDRYVHALIEQGVKVGVLSNTNAVHWPYIMKLPIMDRLLRHGAPMITSHDVGVMKPHPRIYEVAIAQLCVAPERALYLDDIEENVVAAHKVGMQAEQYDCTKDSVKRLDEIFQKYRLL